MSLTYGSLAHDLMFQNGFEGKTCPIVSILTPGSFINEMSHCHRDHHHHYSKFTIPNKTWGNPYATFIMQEKVRVFGHELSLEQS